VNTDHPEDEKTVPEPPERDETSPESDEHDQPEGADKELSEDPGGAFDMQTPSEPDEKFPPAAPPPEPARKGSFTSLLAFLFAFSALAGTAWIWWQDQQGTDRAESRAISEIARLDGADSELDLKIRQLRDRVEGIPTSDSSSEIAALESRLQSDAEEFERLNQAISEQLAVSRSLQIAGEALQRRLAAAESALAGVASRELDAGGELDMAEVDYLLRLANERLKLFHDPVAADETLELADMHLAAMDDPIFLGVRQDIAAARRALAAVDLPDYFAISSALDSVQESIAQLQFQGEEQPQSAAVEAAEEGWWAKLKGVFSGLVTVRRSTELEDQRISLEDRDYVRQRLWLQVEIAHLALMRRDQSSFGAAIDRVRQTLSVWFDPSSSAYSQVVAGLDELQATDIEAEIPDISKPWSTLQQVSQLRSRPAPAQPATEPTAPEEGFEEAEGETDPSEAQTQ
jgi:uroporphyrin-3 C-methyltransferase